MQYLVKLYYMDKKKNRFEYQVQETVYFGEKETIEKKVREYIKRLEKNFNFKVESYSIFLHFASGNIIDNLEVEQ